jgi:uncharacterized protein YdhG (YjbR/CyaY superfamily)
MQIFAASPDDYVSQIPEERRDAINRLRKVIKDNLPDGFQETVSYGMIGYVVPHSIYPKGYQTTPELPLPFINLASQKNNISFYHMGIYSDSKLLEWFKKEYAQRSKTKLDMGKGCIRLKKIEDIPYDLFGELASKITVKKWIETYERVIKR